jgi:hypothetical protein
MRSRTKKIEYSFGFKAFEAFENGKRKNKDD